MYLFIYLAASGLSGSTWDRHCSTECGLPTVVAHRLSSCGTQA